MQTVVQGAEAYGTGYAVQCALAALDDLSGEVVVTMGDVPMLGGRRWAGCWPRTGRTRPGSPC